MGLFEESRSLVYSGPVMRRIKSDAGFTERWTDFVAALLDNYCESSIIFCRGALFVCESHSMPRRNAEERSRKTHSGV